MPPCFNYIYIKNYDGTLTKSKLPIGNLPIEIFPKKYWVKDNYIYFNGLGVWNELYYKSFKNRLYSFDEQLDKSLKYLNYYYYYEETLHIFRDEIIEKTNNSFRTKHHFIYV